jgi:hypothetical protein
MRPVLEKLDALEILPSGEARPELNGQSCDSETVGVGGPPIVTELEDLHRTSVAGEDLVARVIRRAGELRQEWAAA